VFGRKQKGLAVESEAGIPKALAKANKAALANRPCLKPDYSFRPVSMHDKGFHAVRREYPYFGYVGVEVEGVAPVAMFSNNDDRVAQCYFFYGRDSFESFSMRAWRRLAEDSKHILDVGAFSGVYSLIAAQANRRARVYALEPMERTYWRLSDNVLANRLFSRIEAHRVAASDEDGRAELNVYRGARVLGTGSSLVAKEDQTITRTQPVETVRLETFVREHGIPGVDLVKLDVERYEPQAIGGMAGLLEHKPTMLVEVFSSEALREIAGLLSPHGYSFAVLDELGQRAYVEDVDAHEEARNVLFRVGSPGELRAFVDSIAPL
jgi:FkbM family methyltransferase